MGSANDVGRAHSKAMPSSQETSTNSVPGLKPLRSSFITNISGLSVSCRMQLTMTSCCASTCAIGPAPGGSSASVRLASSGSRTNRRIRTDANGEATADTLRCVSTVTSLMPSADRALTAPRAVAPKLITAPLRRRP
jgi:hypothetical protein